MEIKPLEGYILIKPEEQKEKTDSGIILPGEDEKGNTGQGTIVEVGAEIVPAGFAPKVYKVKAGDFVLFTKYGPAEVEMDGIKFVIARLEDILAVLK